MARRWFTSKKVLWIAFLLAALAWSPWSRAAVPVTITQLPTKLDQTYDASWQVTVDRVPAAPLILGVEGAVDTPAYRLKLSPTDAQWVSTASPAPFPSVTAPFSWPPHTTITMTLKRRADTMALLCNHRLVFSAPAPTMPMGTIVFHAIPTGLTIEEARYRRIAPPQFSDDFSRADAVNLTSRALTQWVEDSTWRVASYQGKPPDPTARDPHTGEPPLNPWRLNITDNPTNKAAPQYPTRTNGFWLSYTGNGPSWVVVHPTKFYPSTDRYVAEMSVCPDAQSEVGMLVGYQDEQNYTLFRWRPATPAKNTQESRAELLTIIDGNAVELATTPVGFTPGIWYRVRINVGWTRLQVAVDGRALLDTANRGPVEGRVGLYAFRNPASPAAGEADPAVYFDDVRVGALGRQNRLLDPAYAWEQQGTWHPMPAGGVEGVGAGYLLSMGPAWQQYALSARVQLPSAGEAGLVFHMDAMHSGYAWILSATGQRLQTIINTNEASKTVDQSQLGVTPGTWVTLRVEADGPYIALFCQGKRVLEAYDPARSGGRAGVIILRGGITVAEWVLTQQPSTFSREHAVPAVPQDESWFNARVAEWVSANAMRLPEPENVAQNPAMNRATAIYVAPTDSTGPGIYWHKGGHYGDLCVSLPVSADLTHGQTLYLTAQEQSEAGYRLQFARKSDTEGLVRFWRADTVIGEYGFPLATPAQLSFQRRGTFLLLLYQALDPFFAMDMAQVLREQLIFSFRDPTPFLAVEVGFTVTVRTLPASDLQVFFAWRKEDFGKAPVSWMPRDGTWIVVNRLACNPLPHFIGGYGKGTPALWRKERLEGDQSVEAYLAPMESRAMGFHRGDLNLTICGDGVQPRTGYTLIRGGHLEGKIATMLLRDGIIVWKSTAPAHLIDSPAAHTAWFAVRLEKRGSEIRVYLDDHLVQSYTDPNPLSGGYTAVWTENNAISVGQVNCAAERFAPGTLARPLPADETTGPMPAMVAD